MEHFLSVHIDCLTNLPLLTFQKPHLVAAINVSFQPGETLHANTSYALWCVSVFPFAAWGDSQ